MVEPATEQETARVLRSFLRDDALTTMPRPGRKRRIVLEHIVQVFEPGMHYVEADVNTMLQRFWPDAAALRRYLVEADLLDRSGGQYWRIGGRVDLD